MKFFVETLGASQNHEPLPPRPGRDLHDKVSSRAWAGRLSSLSQPQIAPRVPPGAGCTRTRRGVAQSLLAVPSTFSDEPSVSRSPRGPGPSGGDTHDNCRPSHVTSEPSACSGKATFKHSLTAQLLAYALVTSGLDSRSRLLADCPASDLKPLHSVLHTAANMIFRNVSQVMSLCNSQPPAACVGLRVRLRLLPNQPLHDLTAWDRFSRHCEKLSDC